MSRGANGVPETPDWSIPHAPRPNPFDAEGMSPDVDEPHLIRGEN